jgi:hypothetical protein
MLDECKQGPVQHLLLSSGMMSSEVVLPAMTLNLHLTKVNRTIKHNWKEIFSYNLLSA